MVTSRRHLGGPVEALGSLLGASWEPLEVSWDHPGSILGAWDLLGASWSVLGRLGRLLRRSWGVL